MFRKETSSAIYEYYIKMKALWVNLSNDICQSLEKYPRYLYFSIGNCHLFVCGVHVCGVHVADLFCALCCLIMCLNVLSSCPLRFPHKKDVRFVFTSSCLQMGSYRMCVCLRIVVSNTYCLCFCFVFLRLLYPMMEVSLSCPFLIAPSVFSNVYLLLLV